MQKPDLSGAISRFQQGEKEAFTAIILEYRDILVNFAYKYAGDRAWAEDIAQDILLKVYQELPRYREEGKFNAWLFRIAANYCLNELKDKTRRLEISLDEEGEDAPGLLQTLPDHSQLLPDKQLEQEEAIQSLRQAIAALPEKQRLALILRQYEQLSYPEIAEALRTSLGAVESLLFRARQTLKQKLGRYF